MVVNQHKISKLYYFKVGHTLIAQWYYKWHVYWFKKTREHVSNEGACIVIF